MGYTESQKDFWLHFLVTNYLQGKAYFPPFMGLGQQAYTQLLLRLGRADSEQTPESVQRMDLIKQIIQLRRAEHQQLITWLGQYVAEQDRPLHILIATASMGFNHLWQDLGCESRAQLGQLMRDGFLPLAELNSNGMRWKKFFYRQLCILSEGDITCRSPSCEECSEFAFCFANTD